MGMWMKKYLFTLFMVGIIFLLLLFVIDRPSFPLDDEWADLNMCTLQCDSMGLKVAAYTNYNLPSEHMDSTCSQKATARGGNQRVVSFSFYGSLTSRRPYFQGIERNAKLVEILYPGWVMRVYHNVQQLETRHILCQIQCAYPHVIDMCYVGELPGYGNIIGSHPTIWRFLSMADPLVTIAISRDLDSAVSEREVSAVQEWLKSGASMHVMRDNPGHNVPILAGMWGACLEGPYRIVWRRAVEQILKRANVTKFKGYDQLLLKEEVWQLANQSAWVYQHDSFHCAMFNNTGEMHAFPTQRRLDIPFNFVGARFGVDVVPMRDECPEMCRLKKNWTNC